MSPCHRSGRPRLMVLTAAVIAATWAATWATSASAVNIVVSYAYDTNNFFPPGSQARAAIEATASFYSGILNDTFSAISTPPDLHSATFSGIASWDWSLNFPNPSTGAQVELHNQSIAADEYRIYVGARNLSGSTLGIGGPGGSGWSSDNNGGFFTQGEINQINQIRSDFQADVEHRDETSGFAGWGGAITFDSSGTVWHFNHNTAPTAGTNDFLSVAIHEMGHALGFGASSQWSALASGGFFTGAYAGAEFGSAPPLGASGHWASGTMSRIYGTNTPQEAAMDPEITAGTRKRLTSLDAAALKDIGWSINEPPPANFLPADFNRDGSVNAPDLQLWKAAFRTTAAGNADGDGDSDGNDFLIWQRTLGQKSLIPASGNVPEPASVLLAVVSALGHALTRQRRQLA